MTQPDFLSQSPIRIDAHQHFWKFDPVKDSWITDDMSVLRSDFLPHDLQPVLQQNNIDACIAVQADQSDNETKFLLDLAEQNPFIKGVVGWIDLKAKDIDERLDDLKLHKLLKGFRHILQGEKDRAFMLNPDFMLGIKVLGKYGFTYDVLIYPDQLSYIPKFVGAFPGQKFILDHLAKPNIKNQDLSQWKKDLKAVAQYKNVYCKVSGMVTEADWMNWQPKDFTPYLNIVVEAFGTDRLLFGSDWPVCLVAAQYNQVLNLVKSYFSSFSQDEQNAIFGLNAVKFYNL